MIVPEWLSKDLFQNALRQFYNNKDIEVISNITKDAVAAGENYTCDLFRTKISYRRGKEEKHETMSVIVKCGNEDGGVKQDISTKLHLFEKEAEMFSKIFPALYEILGEYYTLSSKCLYTSISPHSIIVLEDLTILGYDVLPRHIGFDLEHSFKVIEKLAQMHAASVLMYEKDPSSVQLYKEGLYADNNLVREWVSAGFKGLIDACSRWSGYEKYGVKLQKLGNEAVERGLSSQKKKKGGFNVLNHGDLWVNNMMFSFNAHGRLKDMRFIDFQMNIFTSPAIDLHYFVALSTSIDVKVKYIDIILDYYYVQLLAHLTKLQYSLERVPTKKEFLNDYTSRAFYGLMGAATVLAFVKTDNREDASFENIIKDESKEGFRYHAYNNERYRTQLEYLLPYYDSIGILD